jgi:dihydrodipicolinate synthase/N-acetylneuraminate lyase
LKTTPVSSDDLRRSVLAVPPLARNPDHTVNHPENVKLIRHIEAGGVSTLIYGGNANFYNVGLYEYAGLLDFLAEAAAEDSLVIPSVGPDFGKMMDQVAVLRERRFPTVLALPMTFPCTPDGAEVGLRRFADAFGKPIMLYLKSESYLTPAHCKRLVDSGLVCGIKYAIVRSDPAEDAFLRQLLDVVDRRIVISGIGERPAIVHLRDFGLIGFTSGSVCLAPRGSQFLLEALKRGRYDEAERLRALYMPLEDLRDALSPIRVLHKAVSLAQIAQMGPLLPMLSNLGVQHHAALRDVAAKLAADDCEHVGMAA